MNCTKLRLRAITLSLLVLTLPLQAKDKWLHLRTKHFEVLTEGSEADSRKLALKLEQFHVVFSRFFRTENLPRVPVTLLLFKDRSSFQPYKPLYRGKPASVGGFFVGNGEEHLIALGLRETSAETLATIFHEYTHLLMSYAPGRQPAWLQEGLAEYYSTAQIDGNKVTLGLFKEASLLLLARQELMPLARLFAVTPRSPDYNEQQRQGLFYAQAWALVHYWFQGNDRAREPQFAQFVRLLDTGLGHAEAFAQAFGTDYARMERELATYVQRRSYSATRLTLGSVEASVEATARPVLEGEVQVQLGILLLHLNRLDEAEAHFRRGQALAPDSPRPYEGLGFLKRRRQRPIEAKVHLEEALARQSQNHLAHYHYARAQWEIAVPGGVILDRLTPEIETPVLAALEKSTQLMPAFAPAYQLMAAIHLAHGEKTEAGLAAIRQAIRLQPQARNHYLLLGQLLMQKGDHAGARQALVPLLAQADEPELQRAARSVLRRIDLRTEGEEQAR